MANEFIARNGLIAKNNSTVTGSLDVTGSLNLTGSFAVQTYDSFISNAYVDAIQITDTYRTIYDIFGNTSIDAGGRILTDMNALPSANWMARTLFDSSPSPSINWGFRYLYNSSGSISLDWETGVLTGSLLGTASYATQALSASFALTSNNAPNYLPLAGGTMTGDIYAAGKTFTLQDLLLGAGTIFGKITTDGSKYISVMPTYNVESARFWPNGNVTIQDAGTYVDNGFRLDVIGSGRFTDSLTAINGITGSLLGTASYATQALSASYAPAGNPFPYNGNAQISGSFGVTGSFVAITVDDVAFIRNLHDSQTGSGSLDFGNRDLLNSTGDGVFNWSGVAATLDARLYLNQTVSATTRNALITNVGYGGISLSEVLFDSGVQTNDLVYLNTDGKWFEVDQATDTSTKMLGICQGYNPMTYLGFVITEGDIIVSTGPGYPLVQGANYGLPVYIRTSAGTQMSTTIPTSGYVRLLGHCYHNAGGSQWIMKFRPSHEWIEL